MKSSYTAYCVSLLAAVLSMQANAGGTERSPPAPLSSPLPDNQTLDQCLPEPVLNIDPPRPAHPAVLATEAAVDGEFAADYLAACEALRAVAGDLTKDARGQFALAECAFANRQWEAAFTAYLQAFIAQPTSPHGMAALQPLRDFFKSVPDVRFSIGEPRCDTPKFEEGYAPERRGAARGQVLVVPRYPNAARTRRDVEPVLATVEVCIQPDGHVSGARVEQSTRRLDLDVAALVAAYESTFVPGTFDGVAVPSKALLPYNFTLE